MADAGVLGRLLRSVDFQRVLKMPARARSAHFAIHHLAEPPFRRVRAALDGISKPLADELSTGRDCERAAAVDDLPTQAPPAGLWLGVVVPKRHAKRAVTRSLLKREMRQAVTGSLAGLRGGLWVLRLRSPFDRARFPSAASDALRAAAREELSQLMADTARRGALR